MKIYSVYDPQFKDYGLVHPGFPVEELMSALAKTPLPEGVEYVAAEPVLESLTQVKELVSRNLYGGMPVQLGYCNGHNTKLNCLEYHRDSEFNLGAEDFILLVAKLGDVEDGTLDTGKVMAFRAPAGVMVEVYGSTLHYAPCHADPAKGFRVLIALPAGTNGPKPEIQVFGYDDPLLFACNKWLIAHPEAAEAGQGAHVGLTGVNTDIAADL